MPYPTIQEQSGARSATGMAKEPGFGQATTPTTFLPVSANTMEVDPGWFSPTLMQGFRDKQIYNLQGEQKLAGAITGPIFPSNAMALMVASIGADAAPGAGVTGTVGSGSTTLSGTVSAGATSITVASASGFITGQVVQIDVNSGTTTTSECRKITVSGTTFTLDSSLTYGHISGVAVIGVVAPYTHTISQANTLPSLTIEKNLGGFQSLQFAGCRANKFDIKAPVGNSPVEITADMMAQSVAILNNPTPISVVNEAPFVFAEAALTIYGSSRAEASNVAISVENGIKETYTFGNHGPAFLTPVNLHVNGTIDLVWSSLNDATYGDFNRMQNNTLGALTFSLTHPSSGGTITINLPQIALSKYANDLKAEDVIMSSLTYEASRPLSGASQYTISATVVNSVYTAY
ncbi:phage tail tube protein [Streptomyces sp. NPDC055966]|uniref:phage tail tube protein n=1 Tax=Streptomyces sp. NPDC055966 TaxID=3345669 RepID=UPI0035DE8DBE